jgi:type I restriction enzyme, S subunit
MTDLSQEGDTLGYAAKVPKDEKTYLHNYRVGLVEFLTDEVYPDFIYWKMRTQEYQSFILGASTGSSIRHTSPTTIGEYVFELPCLKDQKAIADVLNSLDDKIDLLHLNNRTLEQMADTLYRKWFVEGANESWELKTLCEIATTTLGGTPSTTNPEYWDGDIPWINSGEVNSFRITKPSKYITQLGLKNSNTKILPKGSTVVAITGTTMGKISMLLIDSCANQSVVGIIPNEIYYSEYLYLTAKHKIDDILQSETGGAQPHINKNDINVAEIRVPPPAQLDGAKGILSELFSKISVNTREVDTLESLRNTLLPKMMSGEVRVEL